MILIITLLLIALMLTVISVFLISSGATLFIVIFGDVIVCVLVIAWIITKLIKRRRGR